MNLGMNFESVLALVIISLVLGILGGFAAKSVWVGIGLPIVLIILGLMWLVLKPKATVQEEEKKEENATQNKQE
jgi:uncharacterized membrane protein (Fun14 family)